VPNCPSKPCFRKRAYLAIMSQRIFVSCRSNLDPVSLADLACQTQLKRALSSDEEYIRWTGLFDASKDEPNKCRILIDCAVKSHEGKYKYHQQVNADIVIARNIRQLSMNMLSSQCTNLACPCQIASLIVNSQLEPNPQEDAKIYDWEL
jgi:hypothetical protein